MSGGDHSPEKKKRDNEGEKEPKERRERANRESPRKKMNSDSPRKKATENTALSTPLTSSEADRTSLLSSKPDIEAAEPLIKSADVAEPKEEKTNELLSAKSSLSLNSSSDLAKLAKSGSSPRFGGGPPCARYYLAYVY